MHTPFQMSKKYPFKFLDPYTKEDVNIFFGRDDEIDSLYEMIFQSNILLVYGASGTGKTSLIQCGLASRFQSHDWLALNIRRGADINASLEKALRDTGPSPETGSDEGDWLVDLFRNSTEISASLPDTTLKSLIKAVYLKFFRPIYLIFDQFEELFILGSSDEQNQFTQTVKEILQTENPVKMIFSIREEYLGYLFEFERAIPQLLSKKLRVEPMTLPKVRQVVEGVTGSEETNIEILEKEIEPFTEGVFNKIKDKEKTLTIQLPYLQVFLDKLYFEITKDPERKANAVFSVDALNSIGDIGDILRNFLDEQVIAITKNLKDKYQEIDLSVIWKILSPFATLEGTKEPISVEELYERLPGVAAKLIDAVVDSLVNSRILRYSENDNFFEIAHDSLALRIAESRSDEEIALLEVRRLIKNKSSTKEFARDWFTEKELNFIDPYLSKIELNDQELKFVKESKTVVEQQKDAQTRQEKKRKKWRTTAFVIMVASTFIMIILTINTCQSNKKLGRTIETLEKTQAIARAKELEAFGKSFHDLGKHDFAIMSYSSALFTLKNYPDDSLYIQIKKGREECIKHRDSLYNQIIKGREACKSH
jgi:hypothetical protein